MMATPVRHKLIISTYGKAEQVPNKKYKRMEFQATVDDVEDDKKNKEFNFVTYVSSIQDFIQSGETLLDASIEIHNDDTPHVVLDYFNTRNRRIEQIDAMRLITKLQVTDFKYSDYSQQLLKRDEWLQSVLSKELLTREDSMEVVAACEMVIDLLHVGKEMNETIVKSAWDWLDESVNYKGIMH